MCPFTLNNVEDDPKDVVENVLENITEKFSANITDRQRLIVKRLIATGEVLVTENVLENVTDVVENVVENVVETNTTLSTYFHVTERTIQRDIAKLQSLGIIKHVGPDKGGKWVVIIKPE